MTQATKTRLVSIFLAFVLGICAVITTAAQTPLVARAESITYSGVMEDLKKDTSFNPGNYPIKADDYSLQIIQLAESVNKELFVYVYQPSGKAKDFKASSINISTTINDSISYLNYKLDLLNSNGVFVPVDRLLPEDDIVTVLNHSETEVLFFSEKFEKTINNIKERLEFVKQFICLGKSKDYLTYDNVIASGKKLCESGFHKYEEAKGDTNALRVLVYTSGTTGMPKGVMLSEHNIVSCIYNGMKISRLYDRAISLLPYNHSYEMCGILAGLNNHTSVFINDRIRGIMKNFADFKPESAYLVPSFLEVFYKRINHQLGDKKPLVERLIKVSNALRKVGIDMRRVFSIAR